MVPGELAAGKMDMRTRMQALGARMGIGIGIAIGVVLIGAVAATNVCAQVAVVNPSFESPALAADGFSQSPPPGWTLVAGASSSTGVFRPTLASWSYVAPTGNQVLYLNAATVEQTLSTQVAPGEAYLLAVQVVRRPGFWNPAYRIDFLAGDVLLGSDLGTLVPPNGGSLVSLISYTAGPADPAVGQPLKIRLGGPTQTNYDNVRVFVPEPGTGSALAALAPFVAVVLRRRLPPSPRVTRISE